MDPAQKEISKKLAFQFITQQTIGVIATVAPDNMPEAATVMYIIDQDWTLYVLSHADSRKVENIKKNPHVAFVIGTTLVAHTVQIQATAEILEPSHSDYEKISQQFINSHKQTLNPIYKTYENNYVIIRMKSGWLRYLSFDQVTNKEQYAELIP